MNSNFSNDYKSAKFCGVLRKNLTIKNIGDSENNTWELKGFFHPITEVTTSVLRAHAGVYLL
jgi:hypothetical protein